MTLIISNLPRSWRGKVTQKHTGDFIIQFADLIIEQCKDLMGPRQKTITVKMIQVVLTNLGWSTYMNDQIPVVHCVTKKSVQDAIKKSNARINSTARRYLHRVIQCFLVMLTMHSNACTQAIETSPEVVLGKLRQRIRVGRETRE